MTHMVLAQGVGLEARAPGLMLGSFQTCREPNPNRLPCPDAVHSFGK